jgi:hypothetical protein
MSQRTEDGGQRTERQAQIAVMHAAYQTQSGQKVVLNMFRERAWFEWLIWRTGNPFTISDVIIVCRYLRSQILKGDRNPGCLKFSNMIQDPDRFEEDLAMAAQFYRPKTAPKPQTIRTRTPDGNTTERRTMTDGTENTSKPVSEAALRLLRECKESLK